MIKLNLKAIAAIDENNGLGINGELLFSISDDLERFKKLTTGSWVIMGRKTFESLPNGRLPNRTNVILSRRPKPHDLDKEILWVNSLEELFKLLVTIKNNIWVIGGGEVYVELLPYCSEAYITKIEASREADSYFPKLGTNWLEIASDKRKGMDRISEEEVTYSFKVYKNNDQRLAKY